MNTKSRLRCNCQGSLKVVHIHIKGGGARNARLSLQPIVIIMALSLLVVVAIGSAFALSSCCVDSALIAKTCLVTRQLTLRTSRFVVAGKDIPVWIHLTL